MDPWSVYASTTVSWSTDFGDDVFVSLPSGYYPVVYQQPTYGTVEIAGNTGWRFSTPPLPQLVNGTLTDEWKWRATNGVEFGEIHTVQVEIYNNQ